MPPRRSSSAPLACISPATRRGRERVSARCLLPRRKLCCHQRAAPPAAPRAAARRGEPPQPEKEQASMMRAAERRKSTARLRRLRRISHAPVMQLQRRALRRGERTAAVAGVLVSSHARVPSRTALGPFPPASAAPRRRRAQCRLGRKGASGLDGSRLRQLHETAAARCDFLLSSTTCRRHAPSSHRPRDGRVSYSAAWRRATSAAAWRRSFATAATWRLQDAARCAARRASAAETTACSAQAHHSSSRHSSCAFTAAPNGDAKPTCPVSAAAEPASEHARGVGVGRALGRSRVRSSDPDAAARILPRLLQRMRLRRSITTFHRPLTAAA